MRITSLVWTGALLLAGGTGVAVGLTAVALEQTSREQREIARLWDVGTTLADALPLDDLLHATALEGHHFRGMKDALERFLLARPRALAVSTFRRESYGFEPVISAGDPVAQPPPESLALCLERAAPILHTLEDGAILTLVPVGGTADQGRGVLCIAWAGAPATEGPGWSWLAIALILALVSAGLAHRFVAAPLRRIAAMLCEGPRSDRVGLAQLSQRVAEVTEQLQRAQDRQTESDERATQKDDFLANTAHELRTPLSTILAAVDMLRDGYAATDEEREMFMDQASSACHHMMFLINDLLDTAAHDAGGLRLDMQTCYTHDLLDDALRILMPVAMVRNITIDLVKPDEDLPVRGDPNRAMQVIFNMVGNAVKFSPPQSEISLRAFRVEDAVVFEVEDEGIGVTESAVDDLFTRFGRVHDSSSSTARGNGIGLYMSKVLIEKMGGTIGFRQREAGTGSVFWFRLQTDTSAELADRASAAS